MGQIRALCTRHPRRYGTGGEAVADSYALDNTAAEQGRLNRQAAALRPITERLLRAAGIGPLAVTALSTGSGHLPRLAWPHVGQVTVDGGSHHLQMSGRCSCRYESDWRAPASDR